MLIGGVENHERKTNAKSVVCYEDGMSFDRTFKCNAKKPLSENLLNAMKFGNSLAIKHKCSIDIIYIIDCPFEGSDGDLLFIIKTSEILLRDED